jgi:hypothetical protein
MSASPVTISGRFERLRASAFGQLRTTVVIILQSGRSHSKNLFIRILKEQIAVSKANY